MKCLPRQSMPMKILYYQNVNQVSQQGSTLKVWRVIEMQLIMYRDYHLSFRSLGKRCNISYHYPTLCIMIAYPHCDDSLPFSAVVAWPVLLVHCS